ncbi:MAG TPA: alpha/beta fold hydrolase [Actinomycetales bacterium]|nr:alpha/beta fold hydrolase [Actinomycetales bacterium]
MTRTLPPLETDDGAQLAVVADGPDDAPVTVVLAHGWTLTHHSWDRVTRSLRRDRPDVRVLRADHRDHGASTAPRLPAGIGRLADDLATVIETHAPAGALVLGGHSMGGMTLIALAGRRRDLFERVRGVVLVNTSAGDMARRMPVTVAMRMLAILPNSLPIPRVPAFAARRLGYGPGAATTVVTGGRHGIRPTGARAVGSWFGAVMSHDERAALHALDDVAVTVLAGAYDRLTPPQHSASIAAALPHAQLVMVPRAGHMLLLEQPRLVADHLARLLP